MDVLCVPVAVCGCVVCAGIVRSAASCGGGFNALFDARGGLPVRAGRAESGCAAKEGGTRRAPFLNSMRAWIPVVHPLPRLPLDV